MKDTLPLTDEEQLITLCHVLGFHLRIDALDRRLTNEVYIAITTPRPMLIRDGFLAPTGNRDCFFFKHPVDALAALGANQQ